MTSSAYKRKYSFRMNIVQKVFKEILVNDVKIYTIIGTDQLGRFQQYSTVSRELQCIHTRDLHPFNR